MAFPWAAAGESSPTPFGAGLGLGAGWESAGEARALVRPRVAGWRADGLVAGDVSSRAGGILVLALHVSFRAAEESAALAWGYASN